jgi:hypothetical protein
MGSPITSKIVDANLLLAESHLTFILTAAWKL